MESGASECAHEVGRDGVELGHKAQVGRRLDEHALEPIEVLGRRLHLVPEARVDRQIREEQRPLALEVLELAQLPRLVVQPPAILYATATLRLILRLRLSTGARARQLMLRCACTSTHVTTRRDEAKIDIRVLYTQLCKGTATDLERCHVAVAQEADTAICALHVQTTQQAIFVLPHVH